MLQFSLYAYATVTTTTTLAFPVPILLIQDCCINLLYRKTWHRYDFSKSNNKFASENNESAKKMNPKVNWSFPLCLHLFRKTQIMTGSSR